MIRGRGPGQQDFSEWDMVDDEVGDNLIRYLRYQVVMISPVLQ